MSDSFVLPGMFYDTNGDSEVEDGAPGKVSVWDDEFVCITAPNGLEVRFTIAELEYILEFAQELMGDEDDDDADDVGVIRQYYTDEQLTAMLEDS